MQSGRTAHLTVLGGFLVLLALAVVLGGCRREETQTPPPTLARSMKGYELYSWYKAGGWQFALVVGTNRVKTYDEIAARDVCVEGIEALTDEVARLPAGEQVFWSAGRVPGTTLPPAQTVDAVRTFCQQHGIQLEVSQAEGG